MTLCIRPDCEHHVLLGHLGDYESYNPKVLGFVKAFACKSNRQIRADAAWQRWLDEAGGGVQTGFTGFTG